MAWKPDKGVETASSVSNDPSCPTPYKLYKLTHPPTRPSYARPRSARLWRCIGRACAAHHPCCKRYRRRRRRPGKARWAPPARGRAATVTAAAAHWLQTWARRPNCCCWLVSLVVVRMRWWSLRGRLQGSTCDYDARLSPFMSGCAGLTCRGLSYIVVVLPPSPHPNPPTHTPPPPTHTHTFPHTAFVASRNKPTLDKDLFEYRTRPGRRRGGRNGAGPGRAGEAQQEADRQVWRAPAGRGAGRPDDGCGLVGVGTASVSEGAHKLAGA